VLGEGSRISDSTIEDAVIGLRSDIRGARITRALIMGVDSNYPDFPGAPPVGIGEGSEVRNAIVDKNARIGRGVRILNEAGVQEADGEGWAIREGVVVVPKNSVIPDGTVI
jgi:glucose-1-phosphate adenylyltransferase